MKNFLQKLLLLILFFSLTNTTFALSFSDNIKNVQIKLNQIIQSFGAPITELKVDGIIGPKTKNILQAFQEEFGLKQTGKIDQATEQKIAEVMKENNIQPSVKTETSILDKIDNSNLKYSDMKAGDYVGQPSGDLANLKKYTKLKDGWLKGNASVFGAGAYKRTDKYQGDCYTAMNNRKVNGKNVIKNICQSGTVAVSLPPEVMEYYYHSKPSGSLYNQIVGSAIEIINLENGNCTVAPVYENGPKPYLINGEPTNGIVDLTSAVLEKIDGNKGSLTPVIYRPVPKGKIGCEEKTQYASIAKQII